MVELDVRQAYVDLQVATEQMAVAIENRRVAAEILTQSLDRFAAGVTNSVEAVSYTHLVSRGVDGLRVTTKLAFLRPIFSVCPPSVTKR